MPASIIKSFADKTGKSLSDVERLWDKAKQSAKDQNREKDFAYITGILKKMLGIEESLSNQIGDLKMSRCRKLLEKSQTKVVNENELLEIPLFAAMIKKVNAKPIAMQATFYRQFSDKLLDLFAEETPSAKSKFLKFVQMIRKELKDMFDKDNLPEESVSTNEEVDVKQVISDLIAAKPSDDNDEQGKIAQLIKGLAFSDDPKSTEFMKKLTTLISKENFGSIIENKK